MRILVLEDDLLFGGAVVKSLQIAGHAADWIRDSSGLTEAMRTAQYSCVLLDLGLPSGSGEGCLREIRNRDPRLPIIVISARGAVEDRVRLLRAGADDYMVKPVDLEEVCMRVHVVTRRVATGSDGGAPLTHGLLTLDPASHVASWRGKVVSLTTREFWLLEVFVRRKSEVLSRTELEEALYGWGDEINSNAVEVYVHHLRQKIAKGLIRTVRGMGYRLGSGSADD